MAALVQQSAAFSTDDVTSGTRQLTGVAAGSWLGIGVVTRNGVSVTSVSDDLNGSWASAVVLNNDADVSIWKFPNSAAGNPTVTVNLSALANHLGIIMVEVSGLATSSDVDQTNTSIQFGVNSHPAGSITTAANAAFIMSIAQLNGDLTETAATGFTALNNGDRWFAQYRIASVASLTTDSAFSTVTTGNSYHAVASFLAGAAPGGTTGRSPLASPIFSSRVIQ